MTTLVGGIDNASSGGGAPSGPAGGDLGGTYPNPTVVSVADVTTGILAPANGGVANINAAGRGFCYAPMDLPALVSSGVSVSLGGANQVRAIQWVLPNAITFTRVSVNVVTTSNGNNYFIGIYDAPGTTLIRQATFALGAGTGILTATVASTTLNAGVYWLAWSADQTTAAITGYGNVVANGVTLLNAVTAKLGNSSNSTSGGVMPSSIGTITGAATNPVLCMLEFV